MIFVSRTGCGQWPVPHNIQWITLGLNGRVK